MERNPDQPFSLLQRTGQYLAFIARSGNQHAIHSPFLYSLYLDVIRGKTYGMGIQQAMAYRGSLLRDGSILSYFPAGTAAGVCRRATVSSLVRREAAGIRKGKLLYRLAQYLKPATILELGTHLGVGTMFLSCGCPEARLISLEGSETLYGFVKEKLTAAGNERIRQVPGMFGDTLPGTLAAAGSPDLVWFDGDHRHDATLAYFHLCLGKANNQSVFVFDDIRWSPGMLAAWEKIARHPRVRLAVDLFTLGMVFFREELSRQYFRLRW